jgi:hypothetical protein
MEYTQSNYTGWIFLWTGPSFNFSQNRTDATSCFTFKHTFLTQFLMNFRTFGTELSGNRGPRGEFTEKARDAMVASKVAGQSTQAIADAFGASNESVVRKIITKQRNRNTTKTGNRRRGHYKTSKWDDDKLVIEAKKNPGATWAQLVQAADLPISSKTAKRILRERGLGHWRRAKRILLKKKDAAARLQFAKYWLSQGRITALMRGLFSDECTIEKNPNKPGEWVFRFAHERYKKDLVVPESHGKPPISIMVWAMVWKRDDEGGASKLIFCQGDPDSPAKGVSSRSYCDVLEEGLLPFYEPGDPFMQDNAPVHVKGCSPAWLEEHGIWVIDWPPHSPDLNPIEHVWKKLKSIIYSIEPGFSDLKKNMSDIAYARRIIEEAWSLMDMDLIRKLIESLPQRLQAVKNAGGWYTHY